MSDAFTALTVAAVVVAVLGTFSTALLIRDTVRRQERVMSERGTFRWLLEFRPDCTIQCCDERAGVRCSRTARWYFQGGGIGSYHCDDLPRQLIQQETQQLSAPTPLYQEGDYDWPLDPVLEARLRRQAGRG